MTILNVIEARAKLYSLIDETISTYQPIVITGKMRQCRACLVRRLERHGRNVALVVGARNKGVD